MKILLGIPLLFLAIIFAFLVAAFIFSYRFLIKVRRHLRGDYTDEEVERFSKKYHRQHNANPFDKDYFKSRSSSDWNGTQQSARSNQRTAEGVTIIDDRDPNRASRKIFTETEGEYVDFEEEVTS